MAKLFSTGKNQANCKPKEPDFLQAQLEYYFVQRVQNTWDGGHILHGKTPGKAAVFFSSNDYLSISQHPRLLEAQIRALQEYGNGQMQSSVFLNETSNLLAASEAEIARHLELEACLLTQSGWCANTGVIQSMAQRQLPVYLDFHAHMSFWEGVKSANAKAIPCQHNRPEAMEKRIQTYGPGIIAVDAIYSTTGAICPLADYVRLARDYDCLLIVDESHSLGLYGDHGTGLVQSTGLAHGVHLVTASLAKTLSGRGGFIAGSQKLIEFIRYNTFPTIFSSALLPHDLAGFNAALSIVQEEQWRREKLAANSQWLRQALREMGCNLFDSQSQIIPLLCGSERNAIWLRDQLEEHQLFGAVFCAPATPKNKTLIRISVNTSHQAEQLQQLADCLAKLRQQDKTLPLFHRDTGKG